MKDKIIQLSKKINISAIGFTNAQIYKDLGEILCKRGDIPFVCEDIDNRINPFNIMKDAKTIIVYLCSYYTGKKGNISSYAMGIDYHTVLKNKSDIIIDFLKQNGYKGIGFCDNGPLNDRYLAHISGLGFFGKNGFLINKDLGTYTFIGYIVTNCAIESDKPLNESCVGCNKCITSCPGHALGENYSYTFNKCASYITQKKGELTSSEKKIIQESNFIWGCDICQSVCPHNKNIKPTQIHEFSNNLITNLDIDFDITNKQFKNQYKERAFSWRGKNVIIRNCEIVTKNCDKYNK